MCVLFRALFSLRFTCSCCCCCWLWFLFAVGTVFALWFVYLCTYQKKNWAHLCVCASVCDFSVCDCLSLTVSVWVLFTTHCLLTARTVRTATNCRRIRRRRRRSSSRRRRNSRRRHAQGNLFSWLELLTKLFSCAFFDTFFPTLFSLCVRFLCGRALRRSLANWKTKSKTKSQLEMATPAAQQRSPNYPTSPFSHSLSLSLWRACAQLKTDSMRLRSCGEIRGGVVGQWRGQLVKGRGHALRANCSCAGPR